MLRCAATRLSGVFREGALKNAVVSQVAVQQRLSHGGPKLSPEELDKQYIKEFSRPDIDGWECRQAMNKLARIDMVPDPTIIIAALHACRRVNDYALAVRFLESVKDKCGPSLNEFYPYILQEIKPTLEELGIDTPEALGYDKPELAAPSVDEMHG